MVAVVRDVHDDYLCCIRAADSGNDFFLVPSLLDSGAVVPPHFFVCGVYL